MDENLRWLLNWFHSQCNGQWELQKVMSIGTLDNPGWVLRIRIEQTHLQNKYFQEIAVDRTEHDWVHCHIKEGMFKGYGGPFNLSEVLQIFRNWVEGIEPSAQTQLHSFQPAQTNFKPEIFQINATHDKDNLTWLTDWFYSQCDGDWEHCYGIIMHNKNGSNWYLRICIDETELYDRPFKTVDIMRSNIDWVRCSIDEKSDPGYRMFVGDGGPFNLPEMIKIFRDWAESTPS